MVLALVGDPAVAMTLDLGVADARSLVGRLGADAALDLVRGDAAIGRPLRVDGVGLSPATADRRRAEAAPKWRTHDPAPSGFLGARVGVRGGLRRAGAAGARRPPGRGGRRGGDGRSRHGPARPLPSRPGARLPGRSAPARGARGIRFWFEDDRRRALARALRDQREVAVLPVDRQGRWLGQLDLGDDGRALIADAVRASARRAQAAPTGTRARPRDGGR